MASSLKQTRLVLQDAMIAVTVVGFMLFWWKPFVAWMIAGVVSVGLLSEADHLERVLKSREQCLKLGLLLVAVILLIVLASWRFSLWLY